MNKHKHTRALSLSHTLPQVGAEVSCLASSTEYIAVGTESGTAQVYGHGVGSEAEFRAVFESALSLDSYPIYTVRLGRAPDGVPLLLVHCCAKNRIGVWRLVRGGRAPGGGWGMCMCRGGIKGGCGDMMHACV